MAEKRMFSKTIVDSDMFLDMSLSTQALYFHLSMRADDDGFINNPRKIQRMIGCGDDELKMLIAKRFIIPFESGVCVIKHWRIHNYIQNDRYKPTIYQEEMDQLGLSGNKSYEFKNVLDTECIQSVSELEAQNRLDKNRLDKNKLDIYNSIITHLNFKTNSNFKSTTNKTKKLIDARLNEGFTEEDFKTVIDKKTKDWINNKEMARYLRPETLFGTKFEGYLNEKIEDKPKQKINSPYKEFEFED